ncbi:MAG: homoserine kinase [Alphaproteobacteria bacterium]
MAVYTDVSDEELDAFLAPYGLGPVLSFKGIAEGVENSNFLLTVLASEQATNYILTLYEKRVNASDLPFFIGLMDHLADQGLSCPRPIKTENGTALGQLNQRPAALVSYLQGRSIRRPAVDHCRAVGIALADLHLAGLSFDGTRPNGLGPQGWADLWQDCKTEGNAAKSPVAKLVADTLPSIIQQWPQDLPRGIIHADLFPDNVFFIGDDLSGVIDFYFACTDYLAYDLAITMNAWCFEVDGSFNVTKARALVQGYQSVRPLENAEITALPVLAQGAAVRFLLTRLYDWLNQVEGALVTVKDPAEYAAKLRFHRGVKDAAAYGLANK